MESLVKGFGKLLLFGEHSALYGFPAIGVPLGHGITIQGSCSKNKEKRHLQCDQRFLDSTKQLISKLIPPSKAIGYKISIQSDLPESRGFGSSAALCTALTQFFYPGAKAEEIWQKAHELEFQFHGQASGIDTGLSLAEGLSCFYFNAKQPLPQHQKVNQNLGIWIVPGSVPREESTKELVLAIGTRVKEKHQATIKLLKTLGIITEKIITTAGIALDWPLWSRLTREAHKALEELQLYSPQMNEIFKIAKSLGDPPGKLSGAGGGGAFYFVFPEKKRAWDFYEQLLSTSASTPEWTLFSPMGL